MPGKSTSPRPDCWLCGQLGERVSANRNFRYCPACDVRWGITLVTAGHRSTHAPATNARGELVMDTYVDHSREHRGSPA